jgi:cytochrome P450
MLHKNVIRDMIHRNVIQRELTREQDSYANNMVEEIDYALSLNWGVDSHSWREVHPFVTFNDVVPRVVARVFVGHPLCRNEEYLRSAHAFGKNVPLLATLDHLAPPVLRPMLMPLATAYDSFHYRKITKFIFPLVKERLSTLQHGIDPENLESKKVYDMHNDYVQWALRYAYSSNNPLERTPEMMTQRLTVLNFAATHSTVLTITNILFDIASSPSSAVIQQTLREEISDVMSKNPGKEWTKASLAQMLRLDSAVRESLRLWGFSARGVSKQVVARQGINLPSGVHLPYGCKVGITNWAIHHDESFYQNALQYHPFRFSDPQNATEIDELYRNDEMPKGSSSMVSTGDFYLAFSHGRHAW